MAHKKVMVTTPGLVPEPGQDVGLEAGKADCGARSCRVREEDLAEVCTPTVFVSWRKSSWHGSQSRGAGPFPQTLPSHVLALTETLPLWAS